MSTKPLPEHGSAGEPGAKAVLRAFLPSLWPHRRALILSYLLALLAIGAALLAPWPLKLLIDSVFGSRPLPAVLDQWTATLPPSSLVLLLATATALITIAAAGFSAGAKLLNARVRERMALELRDRALAHLQTLPLMLGTADRSGELVLRLVDDVHQVVRLLTKTLPVIFRHLMTMLATLAVMAWLDWRLGFLGVTVVAALLGLTRLYAGRLAQAARVKRRAEGEVAGLAQEILRGMTQLQACGSQAVARQRFATLNARSLGAGVRASLVAINMERSMQIASGLALALVIGAGGLLVLQGRLTIGTLTVVSAYMLQLLKPVEKVNELASSIARALARGRHLLALLERQAQVEEAPDAIDLPRPARRLELIGVGFAYPGASPDAPSIPVLEDVNLCLEPGTLNVLIGPSGAGKSTLLALILRLFDPTAGEIRLDDVPIRRLRLASLRAQFAVMIQDTHLFAGPLREVLQVPDQTVTDARRWAALRQVALDDFVRGLPKELDTPLGESGANLSGGQRARLSLARALLPERPCLLLDEPLANVDPASRAIILDALTRLRGRRTCLAVTHEMALAECADAVFRLQDRRIVPLPRLLRTEAAAGAAGD